MGVAWWAEFRDWLNRGIWSLFMHRAGHFVSHFSQLPLLPYFSLTSLSGSLYQQQMATYAMQQQQQAQWQQQQQQMAQQRMQSQVNEVQQKMATLRMQQQQQSSTLNPQLWWVVWPRLFATPTLVALDLYVAIFISIKILLSNCRIIHYCYLLLNNN